MKEHEKYFKLVKSNPLESRELLQKIYEKWGVEPFIVENIDNYKEIPDVQGVEVFKSDSKEFPSVRRVTKDEKGMDYKVARWEGNYLYLRVNLNDKSEKLISELRKIISLNQSRVRNVSIREKSTTVNPWAVYDMHNKEGLNLSGIARRLSGIKGTPSNDNPKLMAYYKMVKRAYEKALEMINEVARV